DPKAKGPCDGVRVIEIARYVAAPFCGQLLADLGADVIKIEDPGGDLMRNALGYKGLAAGFEQFNRGKRSFVADLRTPQGVDAVRRLIDTADIVLENYRPGVLEKMGLGYESLRVTNPRLIYMKVSGYGESGPKADQPVFDQVIQGVAGFMPVQGEDGPAKAINTYVVDKVTAIFTSHAALAALLHRERTGEGQKVSTNLLDSYAAYMLPEMLNPYTFAEVEPPAQGGVNMFRALDTADGQVIGLLLLDNHYRGFCKAIGRDDLIDDPRFAGFAARIPNLELLYKTVAADVGRMTTADFIARAVAQDLPFSKVNNVVDLMQDPQARHNETVVEFEDPEFGVIRHANHPATFERSPANAKRRAPKLGEHTDELLAELQQRAAAAE
ncbi:MAG: CoA transferase, partial [Phenylobacterium sp.]|uniref:CaiB/BaiF CoA transferase family protein n=1 Tax=Phenylobacterium sp. TaxID=1871053 RepID=UPI002732708C